MKWPITSDLHRSLVKVKQMRKTFKTLPDFKFKIEINGKTWPYQTPKNVATNSNLFATQKYFYFSDNKLWLVVGCLAHPATIFINEWPGHKLNVQTKNLSDRKVFSPKCDWHSKIRSIWHKNTTVQLDLALNCSQKYCRRISAKI